jgi:Domain of unknown function (DUF397)
MITYPTAPPDLEWHVSSTCDAGVCIMVARDGDFVVFGNTNQPDGPVLVYTSTEWEEFLAGAKLGDFDDIV